MSNEQVNFNELTGIDIAIVVFILAFALIGLKSGFVSVLIWLVTWVLASILAIGYGEWMGTLVFSDDYANRTDVPRIIGSAIVVIVVFVIGAYVQKFVSGTVTKIKLGGADRSLGLLMGAILACCIVIGIGIFFDVGNSTDSLWTNSSILEFLMRFEQVVIDLKDLVVELFSSTTPESTQGAE